MLQYERCPNCQHIMLWFGGVLVCPHAKCPESQKALSRWKDKAMTLDE